MPRASSENSTIAMSARGACSPLRAQLAEHRVCRHGLAALALLDRPLERRVELRALGVAHAIVVILSLHAIEQRVGELHPHVLVEREELLEELLRHGHAQAYPMPA